MAPVNIKFVVSFSSQDKNHKVSNVLEESSGAKRWLTDPQDRSGQIDAVFQLDRPCHLAYIDIGIIWCASVEVRVGKSDWPQGHSYVTLVPTQVLMSPIDSRLSRNVSRTCMFSKAHFTQEGASDLSSWDRIQVIGRQPWRKDVQLGLSFIRIRCHDSLDTAPDSCKVANGGEGGMKKALSVTDIKEHFFGNKKDETREDTELKNRLQKIAATAEGITANPNVLSRNARMVLLANKNCAKPVSPDEDHATQDSAPIDTGQETSIKPEEVTCFLDTLNIRTEDIDSLKVSDLRHKFEKLKWRKLTTDEKRIFYNCCQDFIGQLFDDESSDVSTPGSGATNKPAVNHNECSPHHNDKYGNATKKNGDVFKNSSNSKQKVSTNKADDKEHGNTTPKTPVRRTPNNAKVSGDGKSLRSDQKHCGGFLTSVFSMSSVQRDMEVVTPNKIVSSGSKPQCDSNHKTNISGTDQYTGSRSSSTSKLTTSGRKTVSPSVSLSENQSEGQNSLVKQNGKMRAGDSKMMSPKYSRLHDEHSSPASKDLVLTSIINKSLLSTHRQFVKGRLENVAVSCSSKPNPPSTVEDSFVDQEHLSEQLDTSAAEPLRESTHGRHSLSGLQKPAKKRQGTPLSMLENLNPAKQRLKYCSSPMGKEDASTSEEDSGGWLNAKRDSCGRNPRGGGGGFNRRQQGERSGSGRSGSRTKELEISPSSDSSTGVRGKGNKRGRGAGAARRRLEMPVESTASVTPTPATSTNADDDISDPFHGELQIDEDAVFVECPLCGEMFPSDTVNTHAADCPGKQSEAVAEGTRLVQCPLCEDMYSEDVIEEHAGRCCL